MLFRVIDALKLLLKVCNTAGCVFAVKSYGSDTGAAAGSGVGCRRCN